VDAEFGTSEPADRAVGVTYAADPLAVPLVEHPRVELTTRLPRGPINRLRRVQSPHGFRGARAVGVVLQLQISRKLGCGDLIPWSELERTLSDRSRPDGHGGRPVEADVLTGLSG
jgi:hypothetical protein